MIIDGRTVITGSFNFTKAGRQQRRESVIIRDKADIVAAYVGNFREHLEHSERYEGLPDRSKH
jgi:phosphatidylserine/phosphatidylglycerophosphate/cardiolipin synthase-like enzyme